MGMDGYEIQGLILVHHMNPITVKDILDRNDCVFDEENVICVSKITHNAIHYGSEELLVIDEIVERRPNDTIFWRRS